MKVHTCEQGSPEWFAIRAGMPTASEFATIMSKGKGAAPSKVRRTYMLKLAGEVITGEPMESFSNVHTERGKAMEAQARDIYAMMQDVDPEEVGFIVNGAKGCSPDSLVGANGMVEIKTKLPHLQLDVLLAGELPDDHKAQCQGQLWVAEREWVDFVSYWPKLPLFVTRAYRDEEYIKTLSGAVDAFNDELASLVEQVRAMSRPININQKEAA